MNILANDKHKGVNTNKVFDNRSGNTIEISFLIPTYNRISLITNCINSILINVNKANISNYEIVIVLDNTDNKIKDDLLKVIENLHTQNVVFYQNENNLGIIDNFNRCIEMAEGNFLIFNHDDDLLGESYLEEINDCIKRIDDNFGCIKVTSQRYERYDKLMPLKFFDENKKIIPYSLLGCLINNTSPTLGPTCGIVLKKEAVYKVGGFSNSLGLASDKSLGIDLLKHGYKCYKTINELSYFHDVENASAEYEVAKSYIKEGVQFRKYLYSCIPFGSVIKLLFENAQYSKEIDYLAKHTNNSLGTEYKAKDFDYLNIYKKNTVSASLLKLFRKIYKKINYLFAK